MRFNITEHFKDKKRFLPNSSTATEITRRGKWKFSLDGELVELVDVEADSNEFDNLLESNPDLAQSLAAEIKTWLAEPRTQE